MLFMNKNEKGRTSGQSGVSLLLYLLLIVPLYWGVLQLHGQLAETDARDAWNRVAAPWLGDAPAGITAVDYVPPHPEQFGCRVFIIPPGGDWKARIINTFDMQGEYTLAGEEKRRVLRKTLGYRGHSVYTIWGWKNAVCGKSCRKKTAMSGIPLRSCPPICWSCRTADWCSVRMMSMPKRILPMP